MIKITESKQQCLVCNSKENVKYLKIENYEDDITLRIPLCIKCIKKTKRKLEECIKEYKKSYFPIEEFITSDYDIYVECKSKRQAKEFCKFAHEHKLKWYDGSSYSESTCWDKNRKVIYYSNKGGYFYFRPNGKVLKWSDFKKEV